MSLPAQRTGGFQTTSETASFILLLPGKVLDISALNTSHKFKNRGNKAGAVAAIKELEAAGLGAVKEEPATRGTSIVRYSTTYIIPCLGQLDLFMEVSLVWRTFWNAYPE